MKIAVFVSGGGTNLQAIIDNTKDGILKDIEIVLVVAHGALIRGVVCAAGKKEIRDFWQCPYYNCSLTTLDITHGEITLEREAEVFYDASGSFGGLISLPSSSIVTSVLAMPVFSVLGSFTTTMISRSMRPFKISSGRIMVAYCIS